jgi:hypothetical protein
MREEILRDQRENDDRIHWTKVVMLEGKIVVVFLTLLPRQKYPPRKTFLDLELWSWK